MEEELIGQPTNGNPWGTPDGNSGDFNLFFNNGTPLGVGPIAVNFFTMASAAGGDNMLLTEFDPVTESPVPEPGTMLLFGSGLAGLIDMVRRKIGKCV
jgi:hypothetical protein